MKIIQVHNAGNAHECPVCSFELKDFKAGGINNSRKKATCPICGAAERHRVLWTYLKLFYTKQWGEQTKVLHVAPEKCLFKPLSQMGVNYYPCDLEPKSIEQDLGISLTRVDIQDIPFKSNLFDVIICNHVLEHVTNDGLAMRELFRVLKPGGLAVLMVPYYGGLKETYEDPSITSPEERLKHFGQSDHLRKYGPDYADRLKDAGFEVEQNYLEKHIDEQDFDKYGLPRNYPVFFGRKVMT